MSLQRLQGQGDRLEEAREPLASAVDEASDGASLLAGLEGNERDEAASALETAERTIGPPKRKPSNAKVLGGGLLGAGAGLGIGAAIGAGIGAIAGFFAGSAGIGAAVGAGIGGLLGSAFGGIAGALSVSRGGRRTVASQGTRGLRSETEYDNIDAAKEPALAPERLQALNAAAPIAPALGADGRIEDRSESSSSDQRRASDYVSNAAALAGTGESGKVHSRPSPLPTLSESDEDNEAAVQAAAEKAAKEQAAAEKKAAREARKQKRIADLNSGDDIVALPARKSRRTTALPVAATPAPVLDEEESGTAGSGALASAAADLEMTPEERAIMEAGATFKESGQDAEAVTGVPANAKAMFGTTNLTPEQQYQLNVARLRQSGETALAQTVARPGGSLSAPMDEAAFAYSPPTESEGSPTGSADTGSGPDITPTNVTPLGVEHLDEERMAYYARIVSNGIEPAKALEWAQKRQLEAHMSETVSYTHLTLPTILLV